MSIIKPFNFTAGTKARANEVNENFDVIYSQVNSNMTNIENNAEDIDSLELSKANVNGNSTQRFSVADAISNSDAVNKQTMFSYITNTLDYINGLKISKDSGSPDDTILVSPGSAYDNSHSIVLVLDSNTSKINLNQGANTTYYVYIIGNDSASSIDIIISQEQVTPTLPAGYTKYRQIGYYTTNGDSEIYQIYSSSNSDKITISQSFGSNGYCKFSNGLIIQWGGVTGMGNRTEKTITLPTPFTTTNYSISGATNAAQYAGDKGCSWFASSQNTSNFKIESRFENQSGKTIWWIAIGY